MSKVENLEKQIQQLSPEELAEFRRWFAEFDAHLWDRQFEADVKAGKLDALAEGRFGRTPPVSPPSFESPRLSRLLVLLPSPSQGSSGARRQVVRPSQGRPETPFAAFQEDRPVLVCAGRPPLPSCRRRSARRSAVVLDRHAWRVRQDRRLIGKGRLLTGPPHTTRHAGPHRAVHVQEAHAALRRTRANRGSEQQVVRSCFSHPRRLRCGERRG